MARVAVAIFINAAGGMIVAVVMKFAGNILRNFAQACASTVTVRVRVRVRG